MTRSELESSLNLEIPLREISKRHGKSITTIRYWINKYNLKLKKISGKPNLDIKQCEKCKLKFGNNGSFTRHQEKCKLNAEIIKSLIEDYLITELTTRQISKKYNISFLRLRKLFRFYSRRGERL